MNAKPAKPMEMEESMSGQFPRPEKSYDPEIIKLWFELAKHDWRVLAVVPVGDRASAENTAKLLVEVAKLHLLKPIHLVYTSGHELGATRDTLSQIFSKAADSARVIVLLDSLLKNVAATPIARAADRSLIIVDLERDSTIELSKTIDIIGRDRVIGIASVQHT